MISYDWEEWDKIAWEAIDSVVRVGAGEGKPEPRGEIALLFSKYCKDKVFYDESRRTYNVKENYMKIIKTPVVLMMKLILEERKDEKLQ